MSFRIRESKASDRLIVETQGWLYRLWGHLHTHIRPNELLLLHSWLNAKTYKHLQVQDRTVLRFGHSGDDGFLDHLAFWSSEKLGLGRHNRLRRIHPGKSETYLLKARHTRLHSWYHSWKLECIFAQRDRNGRDVVLPEKTDRLGFPRLITWLLEAA